MHNSNNEAGRGVRLQDLVEMIRGFDYASEVTPVRDCLYFTDGPTILAIVDVKAGTIEETAAAVESRTRRTLEKKKAH